MTLDLKGDKNFESGGVRSADGEGLDFTSLPILGLITVAKTTNEGGTKYGRFNYMLGMSSHSLLNRSLRHIFLHLAGDRSEPNLPHAAWGLLAAIQSEILNPEISAPHMLGPGATLTDAVRKHLDDNKADLAARRKAGEFATLGDWKPEEVPEIQTILRHRALDEVIEGLGDTRPMKVKDFRAELERRLQPSIDATTNSKHVGDSESAAKTKAAIDALRSRHETATAEAEERRRQEAFKAAAKAWRLGGTPAEENEFLASFQGSPAASNE